MTFLPWLRRRALKPKPQRVVDTGHVKLKQLARELAERNANLKSVEQARECIEQLQILMTEHLDHGRRITLEGWGRYETRILPAITRTLPNGEMVHAPERPRPYWKASGKLKRLLDRRGVHT